MFHQRLKSLRLERNMTQQELGDALGIPRGTMAGYESLREPDVATMRKMADYFGVSVDYLVGATDVRQPARGDSFQLPQILVTLTDLANSKASVSERLKHHDERAAQKRAHKTKPHRSGLKKVMLKV